MAVKATKFNRAFHAEFLSARKDVTPAMLAAAKGDLQTVKMLIERNEDELFKTNKDLNNLLLISAANQNVQLVQLLLESRSEIRHRNSFQMDVLDYAVMESVWSPLAKVVLAHYEYIVPEVIDGPYWRKGQLALKALSEDGVALARAAILGKTPDFSDLLARETEYQHEWLRSLCHIISLVNKGHGGLLLLNDELGYLERDALLGGALEMPASKRFVYVPEERSIIKFSVALKKFYMAKMDHRIVEACGAADTTSVQGLLKAMAQPNAEDARGQTALMVAAHNGDPGTLRCLLKAKASVNVQNKDGYSALFLAAVNDRESAVRMLMRAKADVNLRSFKANSLLDLVKHQGLHNILRIIGEEREKVAEASGNGRNQRLLRR